MADAICDCKSSESEKKGEQIGRRERESDWRETILNTSTDPKESFRDRYHSGFVSFWLNFDRVIERERWEKKFGQRKPLRRLSQFAWSNDATLMDFNPIRELKLHSPNYWISRILICTWYSVCISKIVLCSRHHWNMTVEASPNSSKTNSGNCPS